MTEKQKEIDGLKADMEKEVALIEKKYRLRSAMLERGLPMPRVVTMHNKYSTFSYRPDKGGNGVQYLLDMMRVVKDSITNITVGVDDTFAHSIPIGCIDIGNRRWVSRRDDVKALVEAHSYSPGLSGEFWTKTDAGYVKHSVDFGLHHHMSPKHRRTEGHGYPRGHAPITTTIPEALRDIGPYRRIGDTGPNADSTYRFMVLEAAWEETLETLKGHISAQGY